MVLVVFFFFASIIEHVQSETENYLTSFGVNRTAFPKRFSKTGDEKCPCVTADELKPFDWDDLAPASLENLIGFVNKSEYGYGCFPHDVMTPACTESCDGCYQDWCRRSWCYVDPDTCALSHRRSVLLPKQNDRFFSYATCGDINFFSGEYRIQSLENTTLRVALNSNSGGWEGAYSETKEHFLGPLEVWKGPAVEFVKGAAAKAKFHIELVSPPEFLWNRSQTYFNTSSKFDFCVYATALGFVDVCVSQYTITDVRASTTDFMVLGTPQIFLIVQYLEAKQGWEAVKEYIGIILDPFETSTWMLIIFFAIPCLGSLFVYHEYNVPGSLFPPAEEVVYFGHGESRLFVRNIPRLRHVLHSIFLGFLSVIQQAYAIPVFSMGSQINLIAFNFFTITTIAVYTANMASILTQKAAVRQVSSLDEAVKKGYRFCAERDQYSIIHSLHGTDPKAFVPDDDGLPGFSDKRLEVLTRIDVVKAAHDKRYCHAALTFTQDLDVYRAQGLLCDLQPVGQALAQSFTGLPISGRVSESLLPLFAQLNNDALYRTLLRDLAPRNVCPIISNIPNYSIDIKQLCGIWIISFGFSILGLIMTIFRPMLRHRNMRMARVQPVLGYDQFGNDYKRIEFEVIEPRSQESVRRRRSSTTSKSAWTIEQAPLVKDFSDEESSSDAYPRHQKGPKELYIGASPSRSQSSQITLKVRNATQVPEHPRALLMNNTQPRFLPQMQEEQKIAVSSRTGRIELSIPPQLHPSKHDTPRMGESVQSRNKIYGSNLHARIISGSAECV